MSLAAAVDLGSHGDILAPLQITPEEWERRRQRAREVLPEDLREMVLGEA